MKKGLATEIISKAWRDTEYLETLNSEQKKLLPTSPAGVVEYHNMSSDSGDVAYSFGWHCGTYGGCTVGPCTYGFCTG